MKKIILTIVVCGTVFIATAQNINWQSFNNNQKNITSLDLGLDFGMTAKIGYGRYFDSFRPMVISLDYSFPMGNQLMDDFKVRYGIQTEIFESNGFSVTARIYGNFRSFNNDLVKIVGFGSEFSVVAGYYKSGWFAAGEFGFDKSIITHLKHTENMREVHQDVKDGWYIPSGGHFFYGVQLGKSFANRIDGIFKIGSTNAEGKDEDALIPFYTQLAINYRF